MGNDDKYRRKSSTARRGPAQPGEHVPSVVRAKTADPDSLADEVATAQLIMNTQDEDLGRGFPTWQAKEEHHPDLTIKSCNALGDRMVLRVHKGLLSFRSPYFAKLFHAHDSNAFELISTNGRLLAWALAYLYDQAVEVAQSEIGPLLGLIATLGLPMPLWDGLECEEAFTIRGTSLELVPVMIRAGTRWVPNSPQSTDRHSETQKLMNQRIQSHFRGLQSPKASLVSENRRSATKNAPTLDMSLIKEVNVFDSHCHLDRLFGSYIYIPDYFHSFVRANSSAFGGKFEGCITSFCQPRDWPRRPWQHILKVEGIYGAIGAHPSKAGDFDKAAEDDMRKCLREESRIVAITEVGLDEVHGTRVPMSLQEDILHRQVAIAKEFRKPICLHIRGASEAAFNALAKAGLPKDWPLHMHCFTDNFDTYRRWSAEYPRMKFGIVPNKANRNVIRNLPLDALLLETDAPYFPPKTPFPPTKGSCVARSQMKTVSHPGLVSYVAAEVAQMRNVDINLVLRHNRRNVFSVYQV